MLNAIIGAAIGIFMMLVAFAFWILLRTLREFTTSINGLNGSLKPFLSNPNLPLLVEALPGFVSEIRSIGKNIEAMTLALRVFNAAMLGKAQQPASAKDAEVPIDGESTVIPYSEVLAANSEQELLNALTKGPRTE